MFLNFVYTTTHQVTVSLMIVLVILACAQFFSSNSALLSIVLRLG